MPTFEITSPDGTKYRVTGDNAQGAYEALQSHLGGGEAQKPKQGMLPGLADSFTQGVTFGFGDEIEAGFDAITGYKRSEGDTGFKNLSDFGNYEGSFGDRYRAALEANRSTRDQFEEENPVSATAAELAGGLATGAGLAKSGATLVGRTAGKKLATRMGAGIAEGAAYGAGYGAGNADDSDTRLGGAAKGAALGGFVGGAIPAVGSALRKPLEAAARKTAIGNAPTNETLRSTAKALYQQADDAGVQFSAQSVDDLMRGVGDDLATGGYNARLNPKVSAVVDELSSLKGTAPTLERLEQVRRVALNASKSNEPSERMLAGRIIENIDQFVERISPNSLVGGTNKTQAVNALTEARSTWKTLRKSEILEEAVEKAKTQASGFENGLRTQFRSLLRNPRTRKQFTKEEQAAIMRVVNGGLTENSLKFFGKFGLPVEGGNNALGASMGAGLGALFGSVFGPTGAAVGAATVPMAGAAARKAAEAATRTNSEIAKALVRGGKITPAQIPAVVRALESGAITPEAVAGLMATTN